MIDCYTWMTDNGYKPRMMLEETALAHRIVPIDLREKAQMSPEFMKISPGHKIPAIVDHDVAVRRALSRLVETSVVVILE